MPEIGMNYAKRRARRWEGRTPLNRQAVAMQEIHDRPAGDKGITIGDGEVQIESVFNFCTEFDQVEGVASEVGEKGVVEAHLRRRNAEVPRDKGLHLVL